jgi:hypothetical protein
MAKVLTKDATIGCPHNPGKVVIVLPLPVPKPKLTVKGVPVIVKADVATAVIGGCPQPVQTIDVKVSTVSAGEATKLKIRQQGVLLDTTFQGTTDKGATLSVAEGKAGQSKLTAK